ncbi:MAG: class I SAM-dependent methyltransferase [Clostridia bacterium]|nr:class I SAM-dependent methyltransferase [Clostridia bacterium]MDY5264875.1 class I SAM-dependent methyltransferase [Eubacteriales bacterium]
MRESYSVLSKYYDRLMSDFNYDEIASFITSNVKGKNGLELGCGSGKISITLALNGYDMTAMDSSEEMLNTASKNALKKALNVRFLVGDATTDKLDKKFDFIVAICDVFNYMNNDGVKSAINNAYSMLRDGGTLIFDVSTKEKLIKILGDNLYFEEYDDLSYFWQNELDEENKKVYMDLVFFEKDASGKYIRQEEEHEQYYHEKEDILALLSPFSKVETYGEDLKKDKKGSTRLFFKAVK